MKLAAIADIHGNCTALEAVLADIAALGISEVVNLGDHLSGPLEPGRTADLLIARGYWGCLGRRHRYRGVADPPRAHAYSARGAAQGWPPRRQSRQRRLSGL